MPELPEVNTVQQYFKEFALNKPIREVVVHDDKIIRNVDGATFEKEIQGKQFTRTYRQGKYFFGIFDDDYSVLFHLGMTGDLKYYLNEVDRPKYERFSFQFSDGGSLGFDCPRKFARILYLENHKSYLQEIKLGPDALEISEKYFLSIAKGRKTSLKGFLLNQNCLAGVGNLYADEICYQSKIHPASVVNKLSTEQLELVYNNMISILQEAVERLPHYKNYPPNWFWQWRKEGQTGPNGIGTIEKTKIAGRTTYFANKWQKLIQ